MTDFKIRIAAARVNVNMTQKEAAKALGVCENTLIKWETGRVKKIPAKSLSRMSELYKIPLEYFDLP